MGASIRAAALPFVLVTLGACGGGGGGGGAVITPSPSTTSPTTSEVALTSFPAVTSNQTVVMEGTSVTMSGSLTSTGSGTTVTTVTAGAIEKGTVKFSYDGDRVLSAITVTTPQTSFSFDRKAGDTVSCDGSVCKGKNAATTGFAIDPALADWNYQSFGVWGSADLGASSWKFGLVSAGSPTGGSALPTTGSATFNGLAVGLYADPAGNVHSTGADMKANVNFGNRSIQFSTSGTEVARVAQPGFDLNGSLSYAPGVNAFSGSVQTNNGQLNGQSAGRFYGPAAQEIGGVYSLQGTGGSRMVGGFGGKR